MSQAVAQTKKTVLVIDDDFSIREILVSALEHEGYNVVSANNGYEGLSKIRDLPTPAVVLLDLLMPVMDGRQFLNAVLADTSISEIPILVLSATAEPKDITGSKGFLKKPFEVTTLFQMVSEHAL